MDNALRIVRGNPAGFCGYKDDPKNCGYKPYEGCSTHKGHPSCGRPLPDEADLSPFLPAPWNQGLTASGVAHAFAGAVTVALATHNRSLPSPAWPRGIYHATRMAILNSSPTMGIDRQVVVSSSNDQPIIADTGISAWWTVYVLRHLGIPTCRVETLEMDVRGHEYASFLASKINETPKDLGIVDSPLDFHSISSSDPKIRVAQVVSSLATGYPVLGAVDSNQHAFQSQNGTSVIDIDEAGSLLKPDQMVYIVATRMNSEAKREFKIVNSWGWREWTHDSSAWASERFVSLGLGLLLVPRVI